MARRARLAVFSLFALISCVVGREAAAQSAIRLSSEQPLALTPGGVVTARAANATGLPVEVRFEARVRNGEAELTLPVKPPAATLGGGHSVEVSVAAPATLTLAEKLTGELAALTGPHVETMTLSLAPQATPKAAIAKRTINVYAWWPGGGSHVLSGNRIPTVGGVCSAPAPAVRVAQGPADLAVTPRCDAGELVLDVAGFRFNQHHSFVGTVKSGGADTEVTVRYSTFFLWPVLLLLIGVGGAIAVHAWLNGRRDLELLRLRLVELATLARQADEEFHRAAGTRPWARYSITASVEMQLATHLAELQRITAEGGRTGLLTKQQNADLKMLSTDAQPLEGLVSGWPKAHADIFMLLDVQRNDAAWATEWTMMGGGARWADVALAPANVATPMNAATYGTLQKEVAHVERALKLVHAYLRNVDRLVEREAQLAADDEDLEKAVNARDNIEERLRADGHVMAPSEVVALAPQVDEFRTLVNHLPEPAVADVAGVGKAREPADGDVADILRELQRTTPEMVRVLRVATITGVDWLVISAVGLLAIWSGLQALYIGKAWGNVVDWIQAVVWAFTATTVVTPLITALTQQDARRFRLRSDG